MRAALQQPLPAEAEAAFGRACAREWRKHARRGGRNADEGELWWPPGAPWEAAAAVLGEVEADREEQEAVLLVVRLAEALLTSVR